MIQQHTVILRTRHFKPNSSVLEISKSRKSLTENNFTTDKSVSLMFQTSIQIPFMICIII